jgi:predicted nucleotidyltransferase
VGAIEEVLAALNAARVRYLVVGGVAVVLHGHLRTTADLDLVVQLETENTLRAVAALTGLGYQPRAPVAAELLADPAARESWIRDKGMTVFSFSGSRFPGLEVDLFVAEPFDFEATFQRAIHVPLDETTAPVVALQDLLALKRAAARPIDLADIDALTSIAEEEEG